MRVQTESFVVRYCVAFTAVIATRSDRGLIPVGAQRILFVCLFCIILKWLFVSLLEGPREEREKVKQESLQMCSFASALVQLT